MRRLGLLSVAVAVLMAGMALLAHVLLTPAPGDVLVILSARQADHIEASSVELHSGEGWRTLGRFSARAVPKAPDTATALEVSLPGGGYDAIRIRGESVTLPIQVRHNVLEPVLVGVARGRPVKDAMYAGSQNVSLGLNELAGQLLAMPPFKLIDQFGRDFSNASIAGRQVLLAAFNTSCRESCPIVTGLFLQLRRQLPPSVLLIEATTDPEHDTPAALKAYAGQTGASWSLLTGTPEAMGAFWKPFDVALSEGNEHRSVVALLDAHGYIRTYYLGTPDVGGSLPDSLGSRLDPEGQQLLKKRGDGWGSPQILDALRGIGGLSNPSSDGKADAAEFTLSTLDGRQVSLHQFRGRPLLLNFWASWCVPCRAEMPDIERTAIRHPGLAVLLIDERDDISAARRFLSDLRIRSTVLSDTDGKVGDTYGISGLPTTIFVRSDGTIEGKYVGQTNEQILGPHIKALGA